MTSNLLGLALLNARKTSKTLLLCVFGIALGVGMFVFFLSLGTGIQEGVLNRLYPIQQIEFEAKTVSVLGIEQTQGDGGVSQYALDAGAFVLMARIRVFLGVCSPPTNSMTSTR